MREAPSTASPGVADGASGPGAPRRHALLRSGEPGLAFRASTSGARCRSITGRRKEWSPFAGIPVLLRIGRHASVLTLGAVRPGGDVPRLTIGNLDDHVVNRLEERAQANRRSLEGEIRHVLTERVNPRSRIVQFRARVQQIASLTAGTTQTDSVALLREDRDR